MPGIDAQKRKKLSGYDFYREVLGSPKYVVAPMVDQSELAWRRLSRRYGAQLVYTPMINAKMFADGIRTKYRQVNFDIENGEEGGPEDRPLIVQFAANDPEKLLIAAKLVQPHCDAVDINLGCPQDIARRGHYGSYLQEEWDLIYKLINILHRELDVPVTAKFRVFPTVEKTVEYAKMLESAGAQILTCHGRTRDQRGSKTGLADWDKIRAVKQAVSVPVFANGNILFYSDIEKCLEATGADAIMSAEGNLYNPAVFSPPPSQSDSSSSTWNLISPTGLHPPHTELAMEYLIIVKQQKTATSLSAVKGHLFKLMRPALVRETDLRDQLGRVRSEKGKENDVWEKYEGIVNAMHERMLRDAKAAEGQTSEQLIKIDPATGLEILPHWLAQPYFRPAAVMKEATEKADEISTKAVEALVAHSHEELEHQQEPSCGIEDSEESISPSKRTLSDRTPEPDELAKKAKLDSDLIPATS
ncbi:tRNA-dihydrouridine(47) synthase [NAD(P)(+)] [Abortiporus biennis]